VWKIKAYYLRGGSCPIRDWYRAQDVLVRAEFDAALATLRATSDWTDKKIFGILKREHKGLGEIRFKIEKPGRSKEVRRFRPVGIWPPMIGGEFILLLGCEKERNGVLIPEEAFALALDYKRRWEEREGEIHDYI
jgi:hypothetical protein